MTVTRTCCDGPNSVKYATHLPVVIQIKVKPDNKRRSIHFSKSKNVYYHRAQNPQSVTSRSTSSSEICDRRAKKQMRGQIVKHRIRREDQLVSNGISQCDKWRIFQQTPYQQHHANGSMTKAQYSSDDSYCHCDEMESSPQFNMDKRCTRFIVKKKNPTFDELDKLPNEYHPSNSHSQSGKCINLTIRARQLANEEQTKKHVCLLLF